MSNYNVTRFFRGARHSLKGGSISFFMKTHIILEKIFFLSSLKKFLQLKKYSRWKLNIQSIFGRHRILYQKIKKNLIFEIL
jgi:hypothetical protein